MGGRKDDEGKAPLSIIPYEALVEAAKVFGFGAEKYTRDNWRGGFEWTRLIDAALRHINEFNNGEDTDKESGHSHIGHALCCLMMLMSHIKRGYGKDDRFTDCVSDDASDSSNGTDYSGEIEFEVPNLVPESGLDPRCICKGRKQ
jgi:hypothetical protein